MIADKLALLRERIAGYRSCLVAYSGGVDSVFLAYVAHEVLGDRTLAVIADSSSLPRRELDDALAVGLRLGFPVRTVRTGEFSDSRYLENPQNRCYFCKHALFAELVPMAKAHGFEVVVYGENASDGSDHRPGGLAATEFSIQAPLKEVGLTKAEIRELSAAMGLPTADKPEMACLSSRIPTGESVTTEKLRMIEHAENFLRDAGFFDVRVRHHEVRSSAAPGSVAALARIELGPSEIAGFFQSGRMTDTLAAFRKLGYLHVTIDLAGYQRGTNATPTVIRWSPSPSAPTKLA